MANLQVEKYVQSLVYDVAGLLGNQQDSQESLSPTVQRKVINGGISVTVMTPHKVNKLIEEISLDNPSDGVMYPGALVKVDSNLKKGSPTPIGLPRAPVTISVDLPGLKKCQATVADPTASNIRQATTGLINDWFTQNVPAGYSGVMKFTSAALEVYSAEQAAVELGLSLDWLSVKAKAMANVSSESDEKVFLGVVKQIYYTVSMNTPGVPCRVFAPSVKISDAKATFGPKDPPGYVSSVSYGRLLLVSLRTRSAKSSSEVQAALNASIGNVKLDANTSANISNTLQNSSIQILVLGGGTSSYAPSGPFNLDAVNGYIKDGMSFGKGNPGAPISYKVSFLKDNSQATMGFNVPYTEVDVQEYKDGTFTLRNSAGFNTRFDLTWFELDGNGNHTVKRNWPSGTLLLGQWATCIVPGDATGIKVTVELDQGAGHWKVIKALSIARPGGDYEIKVSNTIQDPHIDTNPKIPD